MTIELNYWVLKSRWSFNYFHKSLGKLSRLFYFLFVNISILSIIGDDIGTIPSTLSNKAFCFCSNALLAIARFLLLEAQGTNHNGYFMILFFTSIIKFLPLCSIY